ncbi:MAG: nucleotidyltransferase domain-containing protein [Bacteroidales bacterium]|nr:MAG: nucleotidyltransferase domain-containing protein [Bacteroidales bacterium]
MSEEEKYAKLITALKAKAAEILPEGSKVSIYGSRARGEARSDSDWDIHILIPGEDRVPWSLWDLYAWPFSEIGLKFDEVINPRLYSFSGWLKRSFLPFYKNVERDSVVIFQN